MENDRERAANISAAVLLLDSFGDAVPDARTLAIAAIKVGRKLERDARKGDAA